MSVGLEAVGPFYDTEGLTSWIGVTPQVLRSRVDAHRVLACETAEGEPVYPAWQFGADGELVPGLAEILDVLLQATDPWTAAIWLTAPSDRLGGGSAIEALQNGGDPTNALLLDASEDAAKWAQ